MTAVIAPDATVIRRIEMKGFTDLLVKGAPSQAFLRDWQRRQPCQVHRSFWEGIYVVRVPRD